MLEITKKLQEQFDNISKSGKLFVSSLTGDEVWNIYLSTLNTVHNRTFRDPESSYYNCNYCKAFIRRYGNIVAINDDYSISSLFDVTTNDEYKETAIVLAEAIRNKDIKNIFIESLTHLSQFGKVNKKQSSFDFGTISNIKRYSKEEAEKFGVVKKDQIVTFDHIALKASKDFVNLTSDSTDTIKSNYRASKELFQRCMEEISTDTLELVRDLIVQNSLLNGTPHLDKVKSILKNKKEYDALDNSVKDNWLWKTSRDYSYARFKNELIGVLCTELALGENLNKACENWNKRVDPVNYKKAKAPITKTQIKLAEKFVTDNGYLESFKRRFATLTDIKVTEIKHINNRDTLGSVSIFDKISPTKASRHSKNKFDKVEEITIDKFMEEVLPTSTSVELYLTPDYLNNVVALTTADTENSKPIFKWDNNYSWTYKGNLAGHSLIKQAVKLAGGNITGVLNARLAWNDHEKGDDDSDLDIWAKEPDGTTIGYSTNYRKERGGGNRSLMSGQLDVDMICPYGELAVENITWNDLSKMKDGIYKIWVNGFSVRSSKGFKLEIEVDHQQYLYIYDKPLTSKQNIEVAEVHLKDGKFTVVDKLPSQTNNQDICGLESNRFHQVNLVCLSPNYWGNNSVGNKHYFFMLDKAKISDSLVSFHTENLEENLAKHRKVIEALSLTSMLEPKGKYLAGLGFNATVKNQVILKVKGNFERLLKVKI